MTGSLTLREIACDAVQITDRHRRDMGDLEVLATSIATEGLLQPIGVTEENVLVFGERRLLAVRDILREPTIVARVVHVSSVLAGEYAENEIRKDFTESERVAIATAIEAALGNRQGQRTDIQTPCDHAGVPPDKEVGADAATEPREYFPEVQPGTPQGHRSNIELPEYIPEVEPGVETREFAAKRAGFGNVKTYEQAKRVVDHGAPELVGAMDAGEISIQAAALIATEPPERQTQVVQMPRELRRQVVREIREAAKLPTPSEARRIARETGMSVADNTGVYRSGSSPEVVRLAKADMRAIYDATRGIVAIADTTLDPIELASRLEYWHCPDIHEKSTKALDWLSLFVKGLENNEQIQ
jgi:ParB family chromosome partitioning protein